MKYLIIPIFLVAVFISGCGSAQPRNMGNVRVIPQQAESKKPQLQAESQAQPAVTETTQPETTQNPPAETAGEVAPPSPEAVPEATIEAQPETAELKEGERIHKVDIFESLWSIAEKEYGDGNKWEVIYEANKDQIENPKVIFPKQELIIPPKDE